MNHNESINENATPLDRVAVPFCDAKDCGDAHGKAQNGFRTVGEHRRAGHMDTRTGQINACAGQTDACTGDMSRRMIFTEDIPLAMAYVPMQEWQKPYSVEEGFCRGTIFGELDFPFVGCRMGGGIK